MSRWDTLIDLVKRHDWQRGAEIGVLRGKVFFALLGACPRLSMIGVDTWDYWPGPEQPNLETGEARHSHLPMREYEVNVLARANEFGSRATIIKKVSIEAAKEVPDAALDFVFIDATHTTEAVLQDIAAWKPKIRAGGYITGHDINWPSVERAVASSFAQWREMPGHVWATQV